MCKRIVSTLMIMLLLSCKDGEKRLFVRKEATETGVAFTNGLEAKGDITIQDYLYFYNGGGVALGDINNDGLCDIFLSGNQVKNKLYLNKGGFTFEDISETAGVLGASTWNTGSVMHDFNGDGLLDIYVIAVSGIHGFKGRNELYINNGDNSFTESAEKFGLDKAMFGTTCAFLDYDQDGDLDMYLLNHAVHDQYKIDHVSDRYQRDSLSGDKLFRNDNGHFKDVSAKAGIFGGSNGYGLGLAIADFNADGWPDIHVSNDFHEDDLLYINNRDGTFKESSRQLLGMQSRFSMGSDVADLNQDGFPELLTLDMLPAEEKVLKTSESDDNIQIETMRTKEYGYHYQYSRNMLHVNQAGTYFTESALQSGIAATDWSWSALFADFDSDGRLDLYVSNGIEKRPNDLDYINYSSTLYYGNPTLKNSKKWEALSKMPSGKVANKLFKGMGNTKFKDITSQQTQNRPTSTGATAMADLDNDGDLDLVCNTINGTAKLLMNTTNNKRNYLKIKLHYPGKNPFAIGTKVYAYHGGALQFRELYTARGFQSSSEPIIHLGYDKIPVVDSIKIIWPNKVIKTLRNVATNQFLNISYDSLEPLPTHQKPFEPSEKAIFTKLASSMGIGQNTVSYRYQDFLRQKLLPYRATRSHVRSHVSDFNDDGKPDLMLQEGIQAQPTLYLQSENTFIEISDTLTHDTEGHLPIFGSVDFSETKGLPFAGVMSAQGLLPIKNDFFFNETSKTITSDLDLDGDQDMLVLNYAPKDNFGKRLSSYFLKNKGAYYQAVPLATPDAWGMPTDAVFTDFDADGDQDLIAVGEWMPPIFYTNENDGFTLTGHHNNMESGLWQAIMPFDIDNDGDMDYLLGNWGNNSKFKASPGFPMKMFYHDFDANGQSETVLSIAKNERYYPLETFKELAQQMVFLKKKFPSFSAFAGKDMTEIFGEQSLGAAQVYQVGELRSGYLENTGSSFSFVPFEDGIQLAPLTRFLTFDFDGDGAEEVLAAGNFFGLKPFHGRLGSFQGALIEQDGKTKNGMQIGLDMAFKAAVGLEIIHVDHKPHLLVLYDGFPAEMYQMNAYND